MLKRKIVLVNGPAGSGKDEFAKAIMAKFDTRHEKFARPVKDAVHKMLNIPYSCEDAERKFGKEWKDTPQGVCYGFKPRDLYIWYSEEVMKPKFGKDIFGRMMVTRLYDPTSTKVTVISDSGFVEEAETVLRHCDSRDILLIRLHRDGCVFEGDSRSYITLNGVKTIDMKNRFDLFMYHIQAQKAVADWLGVPLEIV
jgi:hypothetical protein